MTTIRKFAYTVVLALSTVTFAPGLAHAQVARGRFTLPHDVRWQNATVPAGEYQFSFSGGGLAVLRLTKLDGKGAGFMFLVRDTEPGKPSGLNQLVLEDTPEGSYVSEMQLLDYGMTLRFRVQLAAEEKQIAASETAGSSAVR